MPSYEFGPGLPRKLDPSTLLWNRAGGSYDDELDADADEVELAMNWGDWDCDGVLNGLDEGALPYAPDTARGIGMGTNKLSPPLSP